MMMTMLSLVLGLLCVSLLFLPTAEAFSSNGPGASDSTPAAASSSSSASNELFTASRSDVLNLLNHPLQLQLVTGDLPLGSFRRLVADRAVILDGLCAAVAPTGLLDDEAERHETDALQWLEEAANTGKTIKADDPNVKCYNCGGNHLNVDCPEDDSSMSSPGANALGSVLRTGGMAGAAAVLRAYGFSCERILAAAQECHDDFDFDLDRDGPYHGWLRAHADRWTELANVCEERWSSESGGNNNSADAAAAASSSSSYSLCLSLLYNWIDGEASTTGIRSTSGAGGRRMMDALGAAIEDLEPGFAAQRDKHSSFVADITGSKEAEARRDAAKRKAEAAAAYLAAKKRKEEIQ